MTTPTATDFARMSAYIDADGCISIVPMKRSQRSGEITGRWVLKIAITNCDPRLVLWCKNTFSCGSVCTRHRQKGKHRANHSWVCENRKAQAILEGCLPFFIVKREQADIALAFRETITKGRGGVARNSKLPESVNEHRRLLKSKLSALKVLNMEIKDVVVA